MYNLCVLTLECHFSSCRWQEISCLARVRLLLRLLVGLYPDTPSLPHALPCRTLPFPALLFPALLCRDETFFESCGVADLIATCYGGRNRLVAKEYVTAQEAGKPVTFDELEVGGCCG